MPVRRTRVAAAVLAQVVLVGVAVWAPMSARLTGQEVRLRVAPVDPIDPFRGAYVDLGYPDLPGQSFVDITGPGAAVVDGPRGTAFVPLTRRGEVWVGGPLQRTAPADGLYLRCDDSSWRLRCGIESLFLPQDTAAGVQDSVRGGAAVATLRVDARGHAALLGVSGVTP